MARPAISVFAPTDTSAVGPDPAFASTAGTAFSLDTGTAVPGAGTLSFSDGPTTVSVGFPLVDPGRGRPKPRGLPSDPPDRASPPARLHWPAHARRTHRAGTIDCGSAHCRMHLAAPTLTAGRIRAGLGRRHGWRWAVTGLEGLRAFAAAAIERVATARYGRGRRIKKGLRP